MLDNLSNKLQNHPSTTITTLTLIYFCIGLSYYDSLLTAIAGCICVTIILSVFIYVTIQSPQSTPIHISIPQLIKILLTMFIFGIINSICLESMSIFSLFIILSTIRFYGQFQLINCFHHHQLKWDSFLIYHSAQYTIANIFMIFEHILTKYIFQFQYKQSHIFMIPAFIITLLTTFLRIIAFFTAKNNFTHKVAYKYRRGHKLVTNGVYEYLRHPSYTAFYYNTVFGMVMIGNFVSAIVFAIALSLFFDDRIRYEQYYLVEFFGDRYYQYRMRTYVGIPYIPEGVKKWAADLKSKFTKQKQQITHHDLDETDSA